MKQIQNWLNKNGYTFKIVKYNMGVNGSPIDTIIVDTNYLGMHPTKEVLDKHRDISSYIRKYKKDFKTQQVGHYTGLQIWEVNVND